MIKGISLQINDVFQVCAVMSELSVTNVNQRLFQMPKPKNAKACQAEIKEIDLDDLLGGCTETPETKKK